MPDVDSHVQEYIYNNTCSECKQKYGLVHRCRQKTYLSGPMTGLPEFNYPYFYQVAQYYRDRGVLILSPAEIQEIQDGTWVDYMRKALNMLLECKVIIMLPGWEKSKGACLEKKIAEALKLEIRYHED